MPVGFLVLAYLSVQAAGPLSMQRPSLPAFCPSVPAPCCPCLLSAHCCLFLAHPWPSLTVVVSFLPTRAACSLPIPTRLPSPITGS